MKAHAQSLPANVCISTDHLSSILSMQNIPCFEQKSPWKGSDFSSDQEDSYFAKNHMGIL